MTIIHETVQWISGGIAKAKAELPPQDGEAATMMLSLLAWPTCTRHARNDPSHPRAKKATQPILSTPSLRHHRLGMSPGKAQ